MEEKIIQLIRDRGPLPGSAIWDAFGGDALSLWRTCKLSKALAIRTAGVHYLRLDREIKGFARLSPSIWREFLTYSVIGLSGNTPPIEKEKDVLTRRIEEISSAKLDLAYRLVSSLGAWIEREGPMDHGICFIIAGDIVHNMAHDVPRPERSTGKLVSGSDMDLVVVVEDAFPDDLMKRLDDAIFKEKYRLLIAPHLKEEIDYVVKKLARVRKQLHFETFKHMVACKILQEGTLLYGSQRLFTAIKTLLREQGVNKKLRDMEKRARVFRRAAEAYLLQKDPKKIGKDKLYLFYPSEESEEFE